MLGAGCGERDVGSRVPGEGYWEQGTGSGVLGAGCHQRWGGPANPPGSAAPAWDPHQGFSSGKLRSSYPGTTRLLPMRALAFPGGISGLAPCRARLSGTQRWGGDGGDGCAGSVTEAGLPPPSPAAAHGEDGPGGQ